MFTIIFEATDKNEILMLNPDTSEIWKINVTQDDANLYRKKLDNEIMVQTNSIKKPDEIIGSLITVSPLSSADDSFTNDA